MPAEEKVFVVKVSTVLDRGGTAVFQGTEAASERMKAKVQADAAAAARALGEAGREGGEAWARSINVAAKRGQTAVVDALRAIEAAGEASAARDVARAERSAQAKVRADLRVFDARVRAAERAAQAEASARERAAAAEAKSAERAALAKERATERAQRAEEKAAERSRRNFERLREEENRQITREAAAVERAELRKANAEDRGRREKARTFMGDAAGNMRAAARMATDVGKDVVGGLGVRFDVGSAIRNRAQLNEQILDIINQAKLAGQDVGPNAHARLLGRVDTVAATGGMDPSRVARVMAEMQAKSSDLAGSERVLKDLGKLASATGADMGDLGKAAGMVNAQLSNMEEFKGPENAEKRAKALMDIMRHITKQTADGSVEMSDMARYIGRLASSAQNFEGPFEKSMGTLGALSQLAMRGGASTATEATGSASNLVRDLMKKHTLDKWDAAGINLFADKDKTKIRGMDDIIVDYLRKFGGNRAEFAKMFPNAASARAVLGAVQVFKDAGGGEEGIKAVKSEFAKFSSTISQKDVTSLAKAREDSPLARAQRFQNQLEKIADSLTATVLPALEQLAPHALAVAKALASIVGFAAQNPGTAITAAIVGSLAKAGLGMAVKSGIEGLLTAAGGKGGLVLGAVALTAASVSLITASMDEKTRGGEESATADVEYNQNLMLRAAKQIREKGGLDEETRTALLQARGELELQSKMGEKAKERGLLGSAASLAFGDLTLKEMGRENEFAGRKDQIENQRMNIEAILEKAKVPPETIANAVAAALKGGIKVEVTNMPTGGMIPADGRPAQ